MANLNDLLTARPVIALNKPPGPTSHQAVSYVKRILDVDKAGHGGTLDPNVTGVLPIAVGQATRITHAWLGSPKEYVALAYIHSDITDDELNDLIDDYTGTITQVPPVKSSVNREPRERTIYQHELLDRDGQHVLLRIACQGGTYIRKLVHDMGERHGTGAHMQQLHRTKAGPFTDDDTVNLHELTDYADFYRQGKSDVLEDHTHSLVDAVAHKPKITVYDDCLDPLSHGSYLKAPGVKRVTGGFDEGDMVAVLSDQPELVLIGEAAMASDVLRGARNGVAVETTQVYREPTNTA